MPKKKLAKSPRRRNTKKAPPKNRFFLRLAILCLAILIFVSSLYIAYLDFNVREAFEGKRWALPAHVYSSPTELYAGYPISIDGLEKILEKLGYRRDGNLSNQGSYYKSGNRLKVHTRTFQFWDRLEKAKRVSFAFSNNRLERMDNLDDPDPIAILRLDPLTIGSFYPSIKEDRILVKLNDVPEALLNALIAVEDRRFYDHHGISIRGITRAMVANLKAGSIVQGGSTITQQLVKNFYLTSERSWVRKINEVLMAVILDARYSKNEILEAYLNEIYLGQDRSRAIHGFGLASEFYFDRPLDALQLEQVALLVALVKGPSYFDPRKHPERARKRRDSVLEMMHEQEYISPEQADNARIQPLEVSRRRSFTASTYPGFLQLVRRQLSLEYRDEDLTSEGLRIFSTLDVQVQQVLEQSIANTIHQLENRDGVEEIQAASVVTRREGGEIVALSGARDPRSTGFNRALDSLRPIGSLIKPAVYLTALENPDKYTISSILYDTEIRLENENGQVWTPKNFDKQEHGEVPMHTALANSYNLATVNLGLDMGVGQSVKTLQNLGVTRPVHRYPSFLLGSAELSPFEVSQMYQTLAGDGFAAPLRAIRAVVAADGSPLQRYPLNVRQTVDPAAVFITSTILQEAMRSGTGKSVYRQLPEEFNVVGKTGTSDGLRDSWFAGFTGDYLGVVWLGRDDNRPAYLTGATGALQIWARVMKKISRQSVDLIPPQNIELVWIDPESGLRSKSDCTGAVQYPYIRGSAPEEVTPCAQSEMIAPRKWYEWLTR